MSTINLPRDTTLQQIANALDGTFRLLSASVTVNNGVFTLEYTGTAPVSTTASVQADIKGTNQTGLSYTVSCSNGVATFTLTGTADGVYTQAASAVLVLGDYAVPITVTGLPVMYAPNLALNTFYPSRNLKLDYSTTNTIDYSQRFSPENVSPALSFGAGASNLDVTATIFKVEDISGLKKWTQIQEAQQSTDLTFTFEAGTFTSGEEYVLYLVLSKGIRYYSEATIKILEEET